MKPSLFRRVAIEFLQTSGIWPEGLPESGHGVSNDRLRQLVAKATVVPLSRLKKKKARQIDYKNLGAAILKIRTNKNINKIKGISEKGLKDFYDSWEWKRARYDFLKDKKRRCQCCGATPENGVRIVIDHIKPIRFFWHLRLDSANLQILCDDCNMGKGSRDQTDWRT